MILDDIPQADFSAISVEVLLPTSPFGGVQVFGADDTAAVQVSMPAAVGPQGPQGGQGPSGPAGPTGLQGPQGPSGPPGPQGTTGATGPTGSSGATGATGSQGPAGPAGPKGDTGAPGTPGTPGISGSPGPQGVPGAPGPQGIQGPTGPSGPKGADGTSVQIKGSVASHAALPPSGNTPGDLWITLDTGHGWVWGLPGQWSDVGPIQGPAGATGATGATGSQGPAGATGPQGVKGDQGTPGSPGTAGATGAQGPKGDQGIQGVKGDPGPTGSTGATGPQGLQGIKGDTGAAGATGPTGATGLTGATGPQGPQGTAGATGATGPGVPTGGTAGQMLLKQSSTNFDLGFKSFGNTQSAPISTAGSASTTAVMQGMAGTFTPLATGKAFLSVSGSMWNNTAAGLVNSVRLRYGTGTPPIVGAAATGTPVGGFAARGPMTGTTGFVPFCLNAVVTGLTPGTPYWLDVETAAAGGGTVIITDAAFACFEIP